MICIYNEFPLVLNQSLGWSLRFCIPNKLLCDLEAVDARATLRAAKFQSGASEI